MTVQASSSYPVTMVLGSDHAGYTLKHVIEQHLHTLGIQTVDVGCSSTTDSVDYPDMSAKVAQYILEHPDALGILVCGSGVGVAIAANRYAHIRAVVAPSALVAQLSKAHNNTNVLCLGERLTTPMVALDIVNTWLNSTFEGERHLRRVSQLSMMPSFEPCASVSCSL
ncbi:MAG: ribose 5-phosphate isomerase B [Vampirovibrionales bacterium]